MPGIVGACVECGDDDPTEGFTVCLDCLEALGHEGDAYRLSQDVLDFGGVA